MDDFVRHDAFHSFPENPLTHLTMLLVMYRQPRREIYQVRIQKRYPDLDACRHRHLVGIVQVMISKEILSLQVEHLVQLLRAGRKLPKCCNEWKIGGRHHAGGPYLR